MGTQRLIMSKFMTSFYLSNAYHLVGSPPRCEARILSSSKRNRIVSSVLFERGLIRPTYCMLPPLWLFESPSN